MKCPQFITHPLVALLRRARELSLLDDRARLGRLFRSFILLLIRYGHTLLGALQGYLFPCSDQRSELVSRDLSVAVGVTLGPDVPA